MERKYSLDLMRVFLCLCVIAFHSIGYFAIESDAVYEVVSTVLVSANALFFMLSGYFNLEKEFNSNSDIIRFYKNKLINIIFPYLVFLFAWGVWDYVHVWGEFDLGAFLYSFYTGVMGDNWTTHLWFMYPLIGLLLSTPFLSKMLHHMDEKELRTLWLIAIGWNVISYYFCMDFGIDFSYMSWILDGWPIYYFAGYYYRHVVVNEKKLKWIILGVIGFVGTIYGSRILPSFISATEISPLFTIFCMAVLMFFDKGIKIKDDKTKDVVKFLSANTFMIYLFHMRGIEYAVRKLSLVPGSFVIGMECTIGAFVFSLVASMVTRTALKPIQKWFDKIWIVR